MKTVIALLLVSAMTTVSIALPSTQPQDPVQSAAASAPLTNVDVQDLIKVGLSPDVVIAKIKNSPTKFDTSPGALTELKNNGVPDDVILAMLQAGSENKPGQGSSVGSTPTRDMVVTVPDGTEIEIQLVNTISGQEAKVGDVVDFSIVHPVQINGVIIFEKDASARARITTAKPSGRWGRAGKLEWAMQDIQATDGNRVPARFTKRELGDSKGGTVAVAAVATTVLLGPLGLLWGLKKGKPAIIPAGNRYSVFVHGDVTIKGREVLAKAQ